MFDMVRFAEMTRLIEAVGAVEGRLAPNELEMYRTLRARYAEAGAVDDHDATCLEVILRNIGIREAHGFDPRSDPMRVIDLPRKDAGKDEDAD